MTLVSIVITSILNIGAILAKLMWVKISILRRSRKTAATVHEEFVAFPSKSMISFAVVDAHDWTTSYIISRSLLV